MINLLIILNLLLFPQEHHNYITPGMLKEWVTYLSSDTMRGRRDGSPEMNKAALWIADQFKTDGLKQFGSYKDYIQNYSYTYRSKNISEKNIIGYIQGSDPELKDEYIVVSAHFDHIGTDPGNPVDSVFNGADDNAAGTCTMLGIARYIKESGEKPGRSIIFAAFSGEENGMKGSRYFVANCPVSTESIYADINFEMTGHSEFLGKNSYYMTGCPFSDLDDRIKEYENGTAFSLVDTLVISNYLFNSSDNISFSRLSVRDNVTTGVPSGTFATTAISEYLHQTSDEVALFDFENMSALVNHFSEIVLKLTKDKRPISWTSKNYVRP